MVASVLRSASLFLFLSTALSFTPCPLLGPAFPPFVLSNKDPLIQHAMKNLTESFDSLVKTDTGPNGDVSPNTTFSMSIFSSNQGSSGDEPFFWQYHYTSPALKKNSANTVDKVTADTIYRIGGLTEVFTVWSLLLEEGDQILYEPVTKYLPELASNSRAKAGLIDHTRWDEITVGQLASHMSGIARDCESETETKKILRAWCLTT